MAAFLHINNFVSVRLTPYGMRVYASSPSYQQGRLTGDLLNEQLWTVMRIFGDHVGIGKADVFVDNTLHVRPEDIEPPAGNARMRLTYFATVARSAEIAVEKMRLASTDSTLRVFLALAVNSLGTAHHVLTLAASACRESA